MRFVRAGGALVARLREVPPRRRAAVGMVFALVAWVAGLALVAAVGEDVVVRRVAREPVEVAAPAGTQPGLAPVTPLPGLGPPIVPDTPVFLGVPLPVPVDDDLGVSDPLDSAPPAAALLPELPVIELPPLPAELQPFIAVASPTARQVCSTTGVVIVVSALVKADLEAAGVPVSQALTYLGPILAACALFPPDEPSICAVDTALNEALIPEDLRLLVGVPTLAALGLDQVASVEAVLASTGLALPPFASELIADGLGCDLR